MTNNLNKHLDKQYFAQAFYIARISKNLTVEDLAYRIGVSPRLIYSYQNGEKIPSIPTLKAISIELSVSIDSMLRLA